MRDLMGQLGALYGHPALAGQWFSVCRFKPNRYEHFPCSEAGIRAAAHLVAKWRSEFSAYISTSTHGHRPKEGRGTLKDIGALIAMVVDIDIAGPHHAKKDLPPNLAAAQWCLDQSGLPEPTMVIHTGGGLHAWWFLNEPVLLADGPSRTEAIHWRKCWQQLVKVVAAGRGWNLDSVHDLTRVLRPLSSLNHKFSPPQEVRLISRQNDTLLTLDSILEHVQRSEQLDQLKNTINNTFCTLPQLSGLSDGEVVHLARSARNGERFGKLWDGLRIHASESEDDAALIMMLAFYTRDPAQLERLWLASALGVRPKVCHGEGYRQLTISNCLEKQTAQYRRGRERKCHRFDSW